VQIVVELHRRAVDLHGGSQGIRDAGLLDSAVHVPQASFGGAFLHPDLFDMAAAYLVHLAANHPFVDGNRRTAWLAAVTFLRLNGYDLKPRWRDAVSFVEKVGAGTVRDWKVVSVWLAERAVKR
jgi:death-on-curing protein